MSTRLLARLVGAAAAFLALTVASVAQNPLDGLSEKRPIRVDSDAGEVRILAELQPEAFSGWLMSTPGHHAVTWRKGKKAGEALLSSYCSDTELHDALLSIGAKPGNNLSQAAWDRRRDRNTPDADTRVEGSAVDVRVWWDGLQRPMPLESLFVDPGGKRMDLRFGGQKSLIPVWQSGCIVCLQSCPGGKISNRSHTMRDYAEGRATFKLNDSLVPQGRRKAVVIFRLREP